MLLFEWLEDNNLTLPDGVSAEDLWVVGNCRDCNKWGTIHETGVVRTCQQNESKQSQHGDCAAWEPKHES